VPAKASRALTLSTNAITVRRILDDGTTCEMMADLFDFMVLKVTGVFMMESAADWKHSRRKNEKVARRGN
jgi:hypothetical protein